MTTSQSLTGEVSNSSMVPSFCSSAIKRMVRVGARSNSMMVAPSKKLLREASGKALFRSREKKNPDSARNIAPTM